MLHNATYKQSATREFPVFENHYHSQTSLETGGKRNSIIEKVAPHHPSWDADEQILDQPGERQVETIDEKVFLIKLLPEDEGYKLVKSLFQGSQEAAEKQGLTNFSQFKISSVKLIKNFEYDKLFVIGAHALSQRRSEIARAAFSRKKDEQDENAYLREKVLEIFKEKTKDYSTEQCYFLPVWHGTREEVLKSIFKTGFANLANTDLGYYGKGIYGSTNAEYVKRVYSGGYHKGVLLLNWVAINSPFPVASKRDIDLLKGKGNRGNHDAHFIPVKPRNPYAHKKGKEDTYFPLENIDDEVAYDEIAVFNDKLVLARYIVEIERIVPKLQSSRDYFEFAKQLADDEEISLSVESGPTNKEILLNQALELSKNFTGSSDELAEIKNELGILKLRKGEIISAQKLFLETIRLNRLLSAAYFNLAKTLILTKVQSITIEQKIGDLLPKESNKGWSIKDLLNYAIELDRTKPIKKQDPEYYLFLANLKYREPNQPIEEQEVFSLIKSVLEIDPGLSESYDLLGKLLYANELVSIPTNLDKEEKLTAQQLFERAIDLNERYYNGFVHLGELLLRTRKTGTKVTLKFPVDQKLTTRELFEYAIEIDPNLPLAYARLAQCLSYKEIVDFNKPKTRDFLKRKASSSFSLDAQAIGKLAVSLDQENPISLIGLASTLKNEESISLDNGIRVNARELCLKAYKIVVGQKFDVLSKPEILAEVLLALSKTFYVGERLELTEITLRSISHQPKLFEKTDLLRKIMELQPDCRTAMLTLSKMIIEKGDITRDLEKPLSKMVIDEAKTVQKTDAIQDIQETLGKMVISADGDNCAINLSIPSIQKSLIALLKYYPKDAHILDQLGLSLKNDVSTINIEGINYDKKKLFEIAFREDPSNQEIYGHLTTLGKVSLEALINNLKGQSALEIQADPAMMQGVGLYVSTEGTKLNINEIDRELQDEERFSLAVEQYDSFLPQEQDNILLIQGKAGSGKSIFGRLLEKHLWEIYLEKKAKKEYALIPMFISLPQIIAPEEDLVSKALKRKGFDEKVIDLFKQQEFVFILDGFDEIGKKTPIVSSNNFNRAMGWRGKIIITSRLGFLGNGEEILFTPSYNKKELDKLIKYFIVPFSKDRINDYINHYAKSSYNEAGWSEGHYREVLEQFGVQLKEKKELEKRQELSEQGLDELIKEPFLLQLILCTLPTLEKECGTQITTQITRLKIYECFMSGWFKKEAERLKRSHKCYGFDEKMLIKIMEEYAAELSFALFLQNKQMIELYIDPRVTTDEQTVNRSNEKIESEYKDLKDGWTRFFESTSKNTRHLLKIGLKGSPIKQLNEGKYMFIHKSFQEYFAAQKILKEMQEIMNLPSQEEFLSNVGAEMLLNQKDLVEAPSVMNFIYDALKTKLSDPELKMRLNSIVKQKPELTIAVSNIIAVGSPKEYLLAHTIIQEIIRPITEKEFLSTISVGMSLNKNLYNSPKVHQFIANFLIQKNNVELKNRLLQAISFSCKKTELMQIVENSIKIFYEMIVIKERKEEPTDLIKESFLLVVTSSKILELTESKGISRQAPSLAMELLLKIFGLNFFSGLDLSGIQIPNAQLEGIFLERTNLSNANLQRANLKNARFILADLTNADFREADLTEINVQEYPTISASAEDAKKEITCLAITPNGKTIIAPREDGSCIIWDLINVKSLTILKTNFGRISYISTTPDNKKIIICGIGGCSMWELTSYKLLLILEKHSLESVIVSSDGKLVITGDNNGYCRMWNIETEISKLLWIARGPDVVYDMVITPDNKKLISVGQSGGKWQKISYVESSWKGDIVVIDIENGQQLRKLQGHSKGIFGVASLSDSKRIVTGSWDNTSRIWDIEMGIQLKELKYGWRVYCLRVIHEDSIIIAGGSDNVCSIREIETEKELGILRRHKHRISALAVTLDEKWIITSSWDGTCRVWDLNTFTPALLIGSVAGLKVLGAKLSEESMCLLKDRGAIDGIRLDSKQKEIATESYVSGGNSNYGIDLATSRRIEFDSGKELMFSSGTQKHRAKLENVSSTQSIKKNTNEHSTPATSSPIQVNKIKSNTCIIT